MIKSILKHKHQSGNDSDICDVEYSAGMTIGEFVDEWMSEIQDADMCFGTFYIDGLPYLYSICKNWRYNTTCDHFFGWGKFIRNIPAEIASKPIQGDVKQERSWWGSDFYIKTTSLKEE